jgi:hypothetical protein
MKNHTDIRQFSFMNFFLKQKTLFILLALLALIVAGSYVNEEYLKTNGAVYKDGSPDFNREYWREKMKTQGVKRTYQEFRKKNATAPENRQHFSAHVVGGLMFDMVGAEGITMCDSDFGFGCYHGFSVRAIAHEGVEYVRDLYRVCVNTYGILGTGCQHGIGHGILEYVGYHRVVEALNICASSAPQVVPALGCTSGVFMEYFSPPSEREGVVTQNVRSFDPKAPYEPCASVKEQFKKSCYFEFGKWLPKSGGGFSYENSGTVCAGLSGSDRTYCFFGIGTGAAHRTGYVPEQGLRLCALYEIGDELSCRAGLQWAFFATPEHRAGASEICAYADSEKALACTKLSDLTEGRDSNVLLEIP